jgi:hypothetical protein
MHKAKPQNFDEKMIKNLLKECWSKQSSSLWTAKNPARGQCGVTALVIQDCFGGEILKTLVDDRNHFYNNIDGLKYDFTADQFQSPPNYSDFPSSREEAFSNTNQNQYSYLLFRFRQELEYLDGIEPISL